MISGIGWIDGIFWVVGGLVCVVAVAVAGYAAMVVGWETWRRVRKEELIRAQFGKALGPPQHFNCRCSPETTHNPRLNELMERNRAIGEAMRKAVDEGWDTERVRARFRELMDIPDGEEGPFVFGFPIVGSEEMGTAAESLDRWNRMAMLGRLLFDLEVDGRAILKKEREG